jgi:hypothetical protein
MPRFAVKVADRNTGSESVIQIDAPTAEFAASEAQRQGWLVGAITRDDQRQTPLAPARRKLAPWQTAVMFVGVALTVGFFGVVIVGSILSVSAREKKAQSRLGSAPPARDADFPILRYNEVRDETVIVASISFADTGKLAGCRTTIMFVSFGGGRISKTNPCPRLPAYGTRIDCSSGIGSNKPCVLYWQADNYRFVTNTGLDDAGIPIGIINIGDLRAASRAKVSRFQIGTDESTLTLTDEDKERLVEFCSYFP